MIFFWRIFEELTTESVQDSINNSLSPIFSIQ